MEKRTKMVKRLHQQCSEARGLGYVAKPQVGISTP